MEIHVGNRIADISLLSKDGNKVQVSIDDIPYEVDIVMAENGACSVLYNGKSYNVGLVRSEGGKNYKANLLFSSYSVDIVDTQAQYLRMKKGNEEKQTDKVISPMPGKIVKIPVQKGERLTAGNTVMVIEAMKMQSNYKVNADCTVKEILVNEGDAVNSNQVLMVLDLIEN